VFYLYEKTRFQLTKLSKFKILAKRYKGPLLTAINCFNALTLDHNEWVCCIIYSLVQLYRLNIKKKHGIRTLFVINNLTAVEKQFNKSICRKILLISIIYVGITSK